MTQTNQQGYQAFLEKMPTCHCGSGEKIIYLCVKETCAYFLKLNDRMSYKRYYCDVCMETDHDHLPTKIFNLIGKTQELWLNLDQLLHNIEHEFFKKMKDYAPLLTHFDEFAKAKNLNTE
jgi:hypothetical protein